MKNKSAVALGRMGGKKKSERKTLAARENARKGAALRRQKGIDLLNGVPKGKSATVIVYDDLKTTKPDIEQLAGTISPESEGALRKKLDLEKTTDSRNSGPSC